MSQPGAETVRILLVDRDAMAAEALGASLEAALHAAPAILSAACGREAADRLRAGRFELLLVHLPSVGDLSVDIADAVGRLARLAAGALIVALSDGASVSAAMAAMRGGAHDCLSQPLSGGAFVAHVRELAERHGKARGLGLEAAVRPNAAASGLIAASSQMQVVCEQIERSATSEAPVFISGEPGTGKDLCAELLHRRSPRAMLPFVTLACRAIRRDRMEGELFGTARGALSGAQEDQRGAAERADGGTLYLDELGELDLSVQLKLLRFLQSGSIVRLGEAAPRRVDVRVICATAHNPMQLIAERKLREDLFYRLHVLPIHLPPLRQRPADIAVLARHFLARYQGEERKPFEGFSDEAIGLMAGRDWPGNVRQLQELVRRVVVLFEGGPISAEMVKQADLDAVAPVPAPAPAGLQRRSPILPMWRQEQRIIEDAIETCGGNIALAAAALELSPSTIYRKRQAWAEMDGKRGAA